MQTEAARVDAEDAEASSSETAGIALLRPTQESMAGKLRLARIAALPVQLDVRVPVPRFRVSDLVGLVPGRVIASAWPSTDDVPLICGSVQLVWTEFEVVDQTLAVRVTRLV